MKGKHRMSPNGLGRSLSNPFYVHASICGVLIFDFPLKHLAWSSSPSSDRHPFQLCTGLPPFTPVADTVVRYLVDFIFFNTPCVLRPSFTFSNPTILASVLISRTRGVRPSGSSKL